jgi:preprotein translocase subunit SecE
MVGGSNPSGPAKTEPAIGWKDMNKIARFFGSIATFLRETRAELRKVVWPTWPQVRVLTAVVLFTMIGLGAILWGTDALVAFGLSAVLGR